MKPNRALVIAAYVVAALLVVIPITDTMARVWPLRPGQTSWRFGAVGMASRALMTPLLGLLLATGVAWLRRHRLALRALAVLCVLGALAVGAATGVFVLDSMQMRDQVRAESLQAFDFSTVPALAKLIVGVPTLLTLGMGGWIEARKGKADDDASRKRSAVVRPPGD